MTLWGRGSFTLTDEPGAVDLDFVHAMLSSSYWAAGRSRRMVEESLEHAIPLSMFRGGRQVAFTRVVTDRVTFAWIADVVVHPDFRRRGLGTWMVECALSHPLVAPTLQQLLRTRDAHALYRRVGFEVADCMSRRP